MMKWACEKSLNLKKYEKTKTGSLDKITGGIISQPGKK